ncbi:hypothetical protein ACIQU5_27850 [Streptomyces sp. NPDC090306]|uniref:hypothetical protein n=1 Tax=Streptomyces sp. NPDC090306 TaxID=3365961 RepID=UPI0037FEFB16
MQWWQACLWGGVGALLVEAADLLQVLQLRNKLPWKTRGGPPRGIYLLAAALRIGMGVGVASVLVVFGQVSGGFGAVIAGLAAPKIIEGLRRQALETLPEPPFVRSDGARDRRRSNRQGEGAGDGR